MVNTNRKGLASLGSVIRFTIREMDPLTKMRPEDIGVEEATAEQVKDTVNMGSLRLVGQKWLSPIQASGRKGRDALNKAGLQFLGFEGARFVPYELQESLYETFRECQREHQIAVDNLIDHYEDFKNEALLGIAEALTKISGDNSSAQAAYRRVLSKYPTKDEIRKKFKLSWEAFHAVGVGQGGVDLTPSEEMEKIREQASGMIEGLRNEVIKGLHTIMEKASSGGRLRLQSVEAVQRAFDRADALNILGDPQMKDAIRKGRQLLASIDRSENLDDSFRREVSKVVQLIEGDAAAAVKAAEEALTGLGRRRLA
jgi:hypothetical protein